MKIPFSRVHNQTLPFEVKEEKFFFAGSLSEFKKGLAKLEAQITLDMQAVCDRCGNDFLLKHSESINLLVSDGSYEGFDTEFDVVESEEGFIDIDMIAKSEYNLILCDYNYCNNCIQGE